MIRQRLPWRDELAIIDQTMKAISAIVDPEELVNVYWSGIGELVQVGDYVALSRRGEQPPNFLVTRSSRFTDHVNPWTQRDRLPRLAGGLLGELAYANRPVLIDDVPARLTPDDPGRFFLEGFRSLVALPQYDGGEGLNVTVMLLPDDAEIDTSFIPMLHWQAGLFGRGTQNLVLRNQLSAALDALDHELQTVGRIQRSLLPQQLPRIAGFELAAHYVTSARAGGDYYDFFPLPGGQWGIFIADVAGHGTPAAVLMAVTHALAHSQPGTHAPPTALLTYLNRQLVRSYTQGATFVTAFYGVLDPAGRTLRYSAGGHNPPRLARGRSVLSLGEANSFPLGVDESAQYSEATISLERGDLLVLYTDGITEAMAPAGSTEPVELFGTDRLDALLAAHAGSSADESVAAIRAALAAFCGAAPPSDDQTLVALRCE